MKRLALLLATASAAAWIASAALAEGDADTPKPKTQIGDKTEGDRQAGPEVREGQPKEGERKEPGKEGARKEGERKEGQGVRVPGQFVRMVEVCGLSDEQQKQIVALDEARQKALQEIMAKFRNDLSAMLTAEQKAKWNESVLLGMAQREFQRANLTEDQVNQIKGAIAGQTVGATVMVGDEKSAGEAARKLYEQIRKEVLTDAQRATLEEQRKEPGKDGAKEIRKDGDRKEPERREGDAPKKTDPKVEGKDGAAK